MHESPETILQSLRKPQKLPVQALKAANSNRARLAPFLIQELQKFSADFQKYDPNDCLPVIAIYLLAEWEEGDAFETVLDGEIRPLFRQGIADPFMTTLDEFEREAKRDRATCLGRNSERFRSITDTARSIILGTMERVFGKTQFQHRVPVILKINTIPCSDAFHWTESRSE